MFRRSLVHLAGTLHVDAMDGRVLCLQADGSADELHLCTVLCTSLGKGKAHLAAAVVADKTDGINLLVGGTSRDEYLLSGKLRLPREIAL